MKSYPIFLIKSINKNPVKLLFSQFNETKKVESNVNSVFILPASVRPKRKKSLKFNKKMKEKKIWYNVLKDCVYLMWKSVDM